MRFTSKYIAGILSSAHDCLTIKNLTHSGAHQMLVFAMNVAHAKFVSDTLNSMYGNGFSDWVGVGERGRTSKENKGIVEDYKNNKIACLVQVNIASEGFDNPRSSVLVFLNLIRKDSVVAIQGAGRGVRRNYLILNFDEDVCDMFASPDTPIAELIQEFAERTLGFDMDAKLEARSRSESEDRQPPLYEIPPLEKTIQTVEYEKSEIISKINKHEIDALRSNISIEHGENMASQLTEEMALNVLANYKLKQIEDACKAEDTEAVMRSKAHKAVNTLAGNIMRLKTGDSGQVSMLADIIKQINSRWIRSGGLKASNMLKADFEKKYKWVAEISNEIKSTRELPTWLAL